MRRWGVFAIMVVSLGFGCKKDPGPWQIEEVTSGGRLLQVNVSRLNEGTYVHLEGVWASPAQLPTADLAAKEIRRFAATGAIVIEWSRPDIRSGLGRMLVGGRDVGEFLISSGYARALPDARKELLDAEAKAKAGKIGAWGEEGQREILRWLRGRSLSLQTFGADSDVATSRDLMWTIAADMERNTLGFFDVKPGKSFGPPACVDRLTASLRPKLHTPATAAEVWKGFAAGRTLVQVPQSGVARCLVWTINDKNELKRRDEATKTDFTRSFKVVLGEAAVDWISYSEVSPMSNAGGSGAGRNTVTAADDQTFLMGGMPWFTDLTSCERELKAALPTGCSEP